jgi:lysozyme
LAKRKKNKNKSSRLLSNKAWWAGGLFVAAVYILVFYFFFVGPTGFRWHALYGDVNYPEGFEIQGIDVSHYQGNIDWEKLRNAMIGKAPVRFIIVKATEGASVVDEKFSDNFNNAREYGFIRGAYHFYSVRSTARDQAHFFLEKVKLEEGDLPPVLDVEHKPKHQSDRAFRDSVLRWLDIVEQHYG